MKYEEIAGIDVGEHIEKKNGLSYLSWAWAVDQLMRRDATANWTYGEPQHWGETVMVFCTVTAFGKSMTAQLPVMDYRNRAIANPDAFAVNTAMQRCLVKAIALHGLGLYIYAGEDIPGDKPEEAANHAPKHPARPSFDEMTVDMTPEEREVLKDWASEASELVMAGKAGEAVSLLKSKEMTEPQSVAVWDCLDAKTRREIKRATEAA